jgi:hypothetical protein
MNIMTIIKTTRMATPMQIPAIWPGLNVLGGSLWVGVVSVEVEGGRVVVLESGGTTKRNHEKMQNEFQSK